MIDSTTRRQLRRLVDAGYRDEPVALLKSAGLSKVKSIRALEESGMNPGIAKRLVHESPVWAEVRGRDDEFLAALDTAIHALESKTDGPG